MSERNPQHQKYAHVLRAYVKEKEKEGVTPITDAMIYDIISLAIVCYVDEACSETDIFEME
jgi:hypothetical protein